MKALIIGAGAVGVAIAASVSNENMETALVARGRTADYIEQNGVKRTGIFGVMSAPADKVRVYRDYGQIKEAYDYVIISAKTLANSEIADNLEKTEVSLRMTVILLFFRTDGAMMINTQNYSARIKYIMHEL